MTKRQMPPGRNSNRLVVVVKPFGPHHCARWFGSVQVENTSARGASNTWVAMIDFGSVVRSSLLFSATLLLLALLRLLALQLVQIGIEPVEPLFPKLAVPLEPFVDALEADRLDLAGPPLRFAR